MEWVVSAFEGALNVLDADQLTDGLDDAVGFDPVTWKKWMNLNHGAPEWQKNLEANNQKIEQKMNVLKSPVDSQKSKQTTKKSS